MRVTFLGHAGLRLDGRRSTVLVDPWLSPYGAFQASWFQYPENQHLVQPDQFRPAAVVLSHEHLDHLDAWFLSQLPPDVPVVAPAYPSPVLRRKVLAAGSRPVVEVPPWQWRELADGMRVLFVTEDSPMNHDAGVVIVGDGAVVLDLNDARLSPAQLRAIRAEVGGRVDLMTVQAAGASWHPMCYHFAEDHKRTLSEQKRAAKLTYAARAIRAVAPEVAVPFAGPPCFLDPELVAHNDEMDGGVFPDQEQAVDWLRQDGLGNIEVMLPGDAWDTALAGKDADPHWRGFSFADRKSYLADYARRRTPEVTEVRSRHPEPATSLWEPFRAYFTELLTLSPYFNRRIGMRVGFDVVGPGGGAWAVDFRPGHEGVFDAAARCGYTYRFESRWLPPILEGTVPWEDFLLSLRFQASREPDLHNEHLLGLLKFADRTALDAVESYESAPASAERMVVHAEGVAYSVQRRCPHAGADLLDTSEILPGKVLRCLNHYYEFDLETGECLNGACASLDTVRLPSEATKEMV